MSTDIHTGLPAPANASTSSQQTPVAAQTVRWPSPAPPTVGQADTVTPQQERLAGYRDDCAAAQATGMAAAMDREHRLEADMAPLGASYGDEMTLPVAPAYAVPPASSSLYPYAGDEPVPGI